jgi:Mg2+ and Co2+ transporter CorA
VIGRHFRANEPERAIESIGDLPTRLGDDELVWIDVERDDPIVPDLLERLGLATARDRLSRPSAQPELLRIDGVVVVSAAGLEPGGEPVRPITLDIAAVDDAVVSVRDGPVAGLDDVSVIVQGSSELGRLDAASFVAVLLDGVIGAYFEAVEVIERQIDAIDDRALQKEADDSLLSALLGIRRQIAILRRALAPHRTVVAALARPDLGLRTESTPDPWPALLERVERAIDAVENGRELLIGSFDLLMTRTAQRTNDIVRVLTVASVVLLPAVVIAGLLGMNFESPIFEADGLFLPVVLAVGGLCLTILLVARRLRWV